LSLFHQHCYGFDAALSTVRLTPISKHEQRRTTTAENMCNDSAEVDIDGAVQHNIRREVDQQQTVGDVDSRSETEIRRPVSGVRLIQQNK